MFLSHSITKLLNIGFIVSPLKFLTSVHNNSKFGILYNKRRVILPFYLGLVIAKTNHHAFEQMRRAKCVSNINKTISNVHIVQHVTIVQTVYYYLS